MKLKNMTSLTLRKVIRITQVFLVAAVVTGCKTDFTIPETLLERVWINYQEEVLEKNLQGDLTPEAKMKILESQAQRYNLPMNKIMEYINTKYPNYASETLKEKPAAEGK